MAEMSKVIEGSVKLTGEATKATIRGGGQRVRRLGENVVQRLQPNSIPPEVLETLPPDFLEMMERQAFLKRHGVGNVAMFGDLIDSPDIVENEAKLKARVSLRTRTLVKAGVARPGTTTVFRPVVAREIVDDPASNDRFNYHFEKTAWLAVRALDNDHGVKSIPVPDPITPVERKDSPMDIPARRATWRDITTDLILGSKQLDDGSQDCHTMVTFMGSPCSTAILEDWEEERQFLPNYELVVLRHVATFPEDNLLVPAS